MMCDSGRRSTASHRQQTGLLTLLSESPDGMLAKRLKAREEDAWLELERRFGSLLKNLAWRVLHSSPDGSYSESDAASIVTDSYMALAAALDGGSYDPRAGSLRGYLATVAKHRALDELRRVRRRPHPAPLEAAGADGPRADVTSSESTRRQFWNALVALANRDLNGSQRDCFLVWIREWYVTGDKP